MDLGFNPNLLEPFHRPVCGHNFVSGGVGGVNSQKRAKDVYAVFQKRLTTIKGYFGLHDRHFYSE
jgi:hypothetical protein